MKKTIFLFLVGTLLFSCTENKRAKSWGGSETIYLPENTKLVNVTWKSDDLWILTQPMEPGDEPKNYRFKEKSSWGVLEGTIIIKEVKKEYKKEKYPWENK